MSDLDYKGLFFAKALLIGIKKNVIEFLTAIKENVDKYVAREVFHPIKLF